MRVSDFEFELPEDLIALRPATPRSAARLLVADGDVIADHSVGDLPRILRQGDVLVFNDTKVIPSRLTGIRRRETPDGTGTAQIEATLIQRLDAARWLCLAKPGRRLGVGDPIAFETLDASVEEKREGGLIVLKFSVEGDALDAAIAAIGTMPLPPYIASRRAADDQDRADYQTMFARREGAVAAPTAALHFEQGLITALQHSGVELAHVTLHVGAGTFLPVTVETVAEHKMHAEVGEISPETASQIAEAKLQGRRVIPVGTTALRVLETAGQSGSIAPWRGSTDIFIAPGYRFNIADGLMTNFHLPRSTLMMLVSAMMGLDRIKAIYAHAILQRYRFFSYGDASLLIP